MKIKEGGSISNLKNSDKIETIKISFCGSYKFELWINGDCLSYLTLAEVLELKDEVKKALELSIK